MSQILYLNCPLAALTHRQSFLRHSLTALSISLRAYQVPTTPSKCVHADLHTPDFRLVDSFFHSAPHLKR